MSFLQCFIYDILGHRPRMYMHRLNTVQQLEIHDITACVVLASGQCVIFKAMLYF